MTVLGVSSFSPQMLRWLTTLRQWYRGTIVLFMDEDKDINVDAIRHTFNADVQIVPKLPWDTSAQTNCKLCEQWNYIHNYVTAHPDEWILRTDVWDVVFQGDPESYRQQWLDDTLYVSYESYTLNNYAHLWDVGKHIDMIRQHRPINSGVFCGQGRTIARISDKVFRCDNRSLVDQSEFWITVHADANLKIAMIPDFMECTTVAFQQYGAITGHRFVNATTGNPWCVVHGNGSKLELETHYPSQHYFELLPLYINNTDRIDNIVCAGRQWRDLYRTHWRR